MGSLWKLSHRPDRRVPSPQRARPGVEALENRLVPYALTGTAWPYKELVTLSFVPDGTNLGGVSSNLIATLNNRFGSPAYWQREVLRAAQVWAQQTNLNFALVADSGVPIGYGPYQQGDPAVGDIRIGGWNFGAGTLAQAFLPPPVNNYGVAGDVQFNTGQSWVINTTGGHDLFTVAMHEIGHALGLGHSTAYYSAMYPYYVGQRLGLGADDISGIRALYGAGLGRTHDAFDLLYSNGSFATPGYIDAFIDPLTRSGTVHGLDITTPSDVDFYRVTVPAGTSGTLTVKLQSRGFSLLAPTLTVYNGSQQQLGFASGAGQYGTTLTVTVAGVTAGQVIYVRAAGAGASPFGTGAYALSLNFGSGAGAPVYTPWTATLNGTTLVYGSAVAETRHDDHAHGGAEVFPDGRPAAASSVPGAPLAAALMPGVRRSSATPTDALPRPATAVAAPASPSPIRLPVTRLTEEGGTLPADPVEGGTAGDGQPAASVDEEQVPPPRPAPEGDTTSWGRACEACFADAGGGGGSMVIDGESSAADEGAFVRAFDPLAAAAGLALVLGTSRAGPPRDADRRLFGLLNV